jgi:hypothetical protein
MEELQSFLDDPDDVINDPLIIAVGPDAGRDEPHENMWDLGMSAARAAATPAAAIIAFLQQVIANRNRQLTARFGMQHPMVFYAWVDEQAGQLRFSLVSGQGVRPPFGAEIRCITQPDPLIQHYLAITTHDGIPWAQITILEPGDPEPEALPLEPLLVWTVQMPTDIDEE